MIIMLIAKRERTHTHARTHAMGERSKAAIQKVQKGLEIVVLRKFYNGGPS